MQYNNDTRCGKISHNLNTGYMLHTENLETEELTNLLTFSSTALSFLKLASNGFQHLISNDSVENPLINLPCKCITSFFFSEPIIQTKSAMFVSCYFKSQYTLHLLYSFNFDAKNARA